MAEHVDEAQRALDITMRIGPAYDPDGKCAEDMTDAEIKKMMDEEGYVPVRNLATVNANTIVSSESAGIEYEVESTRLARELAVLRIRRYKKLKESDWTQAGDNGLSTSKKNEWKTYRQKLRDITDGLDEDDLVLNDGKTKDKEFGTLMPTWPTPPA